MSLDRLRSLADSRKWYDFAELIKEDVASGITPEELVSTSELLIKHIQKMHPISICSITVALVSTMEPLKASGLLDAAIAAIHSISLDENYLQELYFLEMHKCMMDIRLERLEDIESRLIAWESSKLSDENFSLLRLVAGEFYESIGNIEDAQKEYLMHAKLTKKVVDIEKLLRLSLLSKTFFDFSSVAAFREFDMLEDSSDLKELFLWFQKGDLSKIGRSELFDVLKVSNIEDIRDKIYLINIVMICFRSERKFVYFDTFLSELVIDEVTLLGLLLKALGINIITGWIDSEQRRLFFDRVIPRALNLDELTRVKCKFVEWRKRVGEVIEAIEQEY